MSALEKKTVVEWLNTVDYSNHAGYIPSDFALDFVNFIKLVNGEEGEENLTPIIHYKMLNDVVEYSDLINLCHRGVGKTAVFAEYLILYLAVYNEIPGFGKIPLGLYVSDSIDNGVKNLRRNLEYRWENSDFLRDYVPYTRFTDTRWEFRNKDGVSTVFKGYGAKTGVRGAKEMAVRPTLAIMDDLVSDEDARSPTVIASIEDTVYKAIDYALHPRKRKTIWSGTPFNANDPLYKAVESGAWKVNVYPVCEKFPCTKEEFRGSWEDRFPYEYVLQQYTKAKLAGKIETFNQEMMLRIMSEDDRLILDGDIRWYKRDTVLKNKHLYNFYITTDFATSDRESADFSVISVWAYNNNGDWLWIDGLVARQDMSENLDALFRYVSDYKPLGVGVEVSGQQTGFVSWIQDEMVRRNVYFTLTSDSNGNNPGIRPFTNKMVRFQVVVPLFKQGKIYFPKEYQDEHPAIIEAMDELSLASPKGFRSKHDDFIDTISMLALMKAFKPDTTGDLVQKQDKDIWEDEDAIPSRGNSRISGYLA
jgi:phage terminase large subunit-like protein